MRPTPAIWPGRIRPLLLLLLAGGAVSSCTEGPTGTTTVKRIEIWVPWTTLRPGDQVQAYATPLDANGVIVATAPVQWRSLTPATLEVNSLGIVTALRPGAGIVRASVQDVNRSITLSFVNPPIVSISVSIDTLRLSLPGGIGQLVAAPRDAEGLPVVGEDLEWSSSASRIATVDANGQVRAVAVGTTRVSVMAQGVTRSVEVLVDAPPTATSPTITSVAPVVALPGATLVVNGSGFSGSVGANQVLIDGVAVSVTSASATQLILSLPAAAEFPCEPTRVVALQVNAPAGIGTIPLTLKVATSRDLLVGQSVTLASLAEARCNELGPAAGRYVVTVPNAARALGAGPIAFSIRGAATPEGGGAGGAAAPLVTRWNAGAVRPSSARSRSAMHHRLLEANRIGYGRAPQASVRAGAVAASLEGGTIVPLRFPNIGAESFCANYTPIGARVAYAGTRVTILEDTISSVGGAPTLAGQQDALLADLGAELDLLAWPVLETFGDPLVMDSRLDADGRIRIVLTPRMNAAAGGAALAAVVNCDFYPRAQLPSSNMGEYVYAQVPTSADVGFAPGTRERWLHEIRATLVHELKHVTSYAERIVRNHPREEAWLEEATARHAEELYARAIFGTVRFGDHDATATLACELLAGDPAAPQCVGRPRAMRPHLEALWTFLADPAMRSPLGQPEDLPGDFSFYGTSWALTRWLLDQEALSEQAFFTALTTSSQSGITNLSARSGRSWDEMLPEWSLAMLTDGRLATPPASSRLTFPSWNLASLFLGLCEYAGNCGTAMLESSFDRPHPWQPQQIATGAFLFEVPQVEPGGFAAFELVAGAPGRRQLLELKGYRAAPLPATARMGILRVQ